MTTFRAGFIFWTWSLETASASVFLDRVEGLEPGLAGDEAQAPPNPLDDPRQEADVGQDVEDGDDQEDREQRADDEVHGRGVHALGADPVRQGEVNALPRHRDELVEARGRALDGGAAPREAREDPGDDEVERGEDTDRLPVDLPAVVGEQPSCGEEDDNSQDIDG